MTAVAGDRQPPVDPEGYAVDRASGVVHRRHAEHAADLPRTRTGAGLANLLGGREGRACLECWPPPVELEREPASAPRQRRARPASRAARPAAVTPPTAAKDEPDVVDPDPPQADEQPLDVAAESAPELGDDDRATIDEPGGS